MTITAVKQSADLKAAVEFQLILATSTPSGLASLIGTEPNRKFYRRLAGLRGSDLSPKQDNRYDANGKRVRA